MKKPRKRKVCAWCGRHRYTDMFYKQTNGDPRPECKECSIRARQNQGAFR